MPNTFTIVTAGGGASAVREMMITYLDTGTADAPVWSAMGAKVAEGTIEYDWGAETKTDILGNVYTSAKSAQMKQTFSGGEIIAGDIVMNHLVDLAIVQKDAARLVNQDCLIVHTYLQNDDGAAFAERYPASAVIPSSLGGEGGAALVTDIDVTFGGKRVIGTAKVGNDGVTFTPEAAAAANAEE